MGNSNSDGSSSSSSNNINIVVQITNTCIRGCFMVPWLEHGTGNLYVIGSDFF